MGVERGKVSVLEPEPGAFQQVTKSLVESGFEVSLHASSDKLLPTIHRTSPDAAVIPVTADELQSATLIADLRAKSRDIPIVLVADETTVSQVGALLEVGASAYLILPHVDLALVAYTIESCMARRVELRRQQRSEKELKQLNRALVDSVSALEEDQR